MRKPEGAAVRPHYRVTAERDDGYWLLRVVELDKATEVRRLDQADEYVRDLVRIHTGRRADSFDWSLEPIDMPVVDHARELREQAAIAAQHAAAGTAEAVTQLHERGLPMRDIGVLLGLSHQRVAQLLDDRS